MQAVLIAIAFAFLQFASAAAAEGELVHTIRLADYNGGSIDAWLRGKGFAFEQDAKQRSQIGLGVGNNGLIVTTKRRALGIMPNEGVNLSDFSFIEIDWGVDKFPAGASYEKGVRNEALMVIVFMGDERQPSGSMFIPDSPYFIGLFLCHGDDKTNFPYIGSHFKKGGRYVCVDRPAAGTQVTTRFNLFEAYRAYFDKEQAADPGISGIALAVDTKKADGGGVAEAFIKEIRFYR